MNPTLKIAVESIWSDERPAWDSIPDEEKCYNGRWKFIGKLNDFKTLLSKTGYITNAVSLGLTDSIKNAIPFLSRKCTLSRSLYINGIYPCDVEGIDKPCVGYFWTHPHSYGGSFYQQNGYVCFADDIEACEYAEEVYNKKEPLI